MASATLRRDLESLLLVSARPLTVRHLAKLTGSTEDDVRVALDELKQVYNTDQRGIQLQQAGQQVQLVTSPLAAKLIADFLKAEQSGDLTDPAIETLTIIAYRGPISKLELDQIRGVNCSLILRHLMIRGLVESEDDDAQMTTRYSVTLDFLRFLGLASIDQLPDYHALRNDENLKQLFALEQPGAAVTATPAAVEVAAVVTDAVEGSDDDEEDET